MRATALMIRRVLFLLVIAILLAIGLLVLNSPAVVGASNPDKMDDFKQEVECGISRAKMLLQVMRIGNETSASSPETEFLYGELVGLLMARYMIEEIALEEEICSVVATARTQAKVVVDEIKKENPDLVKSLNTCARVQ